MTYASNYRAYAKAHGMTPEQMDRFDAEQHDGSMLGFMLWANVPLIPSKHPDYQPKPVGETCECHPRRISEVPAHCLTESLWLPPVESGEDSEFGPVHKKHNSRELPGTAGVYKSHRHE